MTSRSGSLMFDFGVATSCLDGLCCRPCAIAFLADSANQDRADSLMPWTCSTMSLSSSATVGVPPRCRSPVVGLGGATVGACGWGWRVAARRSSWFLLRLVQVFNLCSSARSLHRAAAQASQVFSEGSHLFILSSIVRLVTICGSAVCCVDWFCGRSLVNSQNLLKNASILRCFGNASATADSDLQHGKLQIGRHRESSLPPESG